MGFCDEAARDGSCDGPGEASGGEDADGVRAGDGVPEIGEDAADDGERGGGEETSQEPAYADGGDVLRERYGDLEDGEQGVAAEEGDTASEDLGHGTECDGTDDKAL